jgi:AraC family transcriptional regulator of adaptative response/methylated-DNA-[protein]-cysteine methyltransferase
VQRKDRAHDGRFVFAVCTTGVFCRPSCPARTPLRANVRFFDDAATARRAGFRACLRCHPEGRTAAEEMAAKVRAACQWLQRAEERVTLAELAARAGSSAHHFQRAFKAALGVTPRQFQAQLRAARVRASLGSARTVTEGAYAAGFASSARFYDAIGETLGMAPTRFRAAGKGERIRYAVTDSSFGKLLVAATGRGVCAVEFGDSATELEAGLRARFCGAQWLGMDPEFRGWLAAVVELIERRAPQADIPLDLRGTAFQRQVWNALRRIPRGATLSYAELAQRIGKGGAQRAVASACAQNPLAVVVPCHRVVRADGDLAGYRWGVGRKAKLLGAEAAAPLPRPAQRAKN